MHRHTGPAPGIMVWISIGFHCRIPVVHIAGTLNRQRYISNLLETVVLPYIQRLPSAIFQQDNACPHVARDFQKFFTHQIELIPCATTAPEYTTLCYTKSTLAICGSRMD
ncbi:transposable element Tcb1 transposase [Trichonephila clavipes]|nr:transposable element Tcb1 transposase [Trichonephila clavipes]